MLWGTSERARQRRTVRELERRMAELDRLDREYGQTSFGPGDLEGLAILGDLDC